MRESFILKMGANRMSEKAGERARSGARFFKNTDTVNLRIQKPTTASGLAGWNKFGWLVG